MGRGAGAHEVSTTVISGGPPGRDRGISFVDSAGHKNKPSPQETAQAAEKAFRQAPPSQKKKNPRSGRGHLPLAAAPDVICKDQIVHVSQALAVQFHSCPPFPCFGFNISRRPSCRKPYF